MIDKLNPFEKNNDRYVNPHQPRNLVDQQRLAKLVGAVAFGLPLSLLLLSAFNSICFHHTISHFYHAPYAGGIFVISLSMIAAILFIYNGEHPKEALLASYASLATIIIAFIPTSRVGCEDNQHLVRPFTNKLGDSYTHTSPFEMFPNAEYFHIAATLSLFIFLGWYSSYVFTRVKPQAHIKDGKLIPSKAARNKIYTYCGRIIWIVIAIFLTNGILYYLNIRFEFWNQYRFSFILETIGLWSFGYSWLVKGRIFKKYWDPQDHENRATG